MTLGTLADFLVERDPREAEEVLLSSIESLAAAMDRGNIALSLASAAAVAARLEDPERAGTLWGAFEAEAERQPRPSTDQAMALSEPSLEVVRGEVFEQARSRGRTLSLEEAVAYALRHD